MSTTTEIAADQDIPTINDPGTISNIPNIPPRTLRINASHDSGNDKHNSVYRDHRDNNECNDDVGKREDPRNWYHEGYRNTKRCGHIDHILRDIDPEYAWRSTGHVDYHSWLIRCRNILATSSSFASRAFTYCSIDLFRGSLFGVATRVLCHSHQSFGGLEI